MSETFLGETQTSTQTCETKSLRMANQLNQYVLSIAMTVERGRMSV